MAPADGAGQGGAYVSRPLDGWYEKAGVRAQRRRFLDEDQEAGLVPFPEDQIPYLGHEGLAGLSPGARHTVMLHHLFQYLLYTAHLETKVVNRAAVLLAHDEVGFTVAPEARLDALRIYCDEGYHALYSVDVVHQLEQFTGVPALPYDFTPRLDRLDRDGHRFLPDRPRLAQLLQVVVFETVVTTILADIPQDRTVYRVVRDIVADHARDEARHHAFFSRLFRELWASLPRNLRISVARTLPSFVDGCLRPELAPVRASLRAAGLPPDGIEEVLADCYPEDVVRASVRGAARHTLQLCETVGVFDLPGARDELYRLGLSE